MSLLSVCFKALERLILQRINPVLEDTIVAEQAGFKSNHSTCYQVLALATYVENGYRTNQKTGIL